MSALTNERDMLLVRLSGAQNQLLKSKSCARNCATAAGLRMQIMGEEIHVALKSLASSDRLLSYAAGMLLLELPLFSCKAQDMNIVTKGCTAAIQAGVRSRIRFLRIVTASLQRCRKELLSTDNNDNDNDSQRPSETDDTSEESSCISCQCKLHADGPIDQHSYFEQQAIFWVKQLIDQWSLLHEFATAESNNLAADASFDAMTLIELFDFGTLVTELKDHDGLDAASVQNILWQIVDFTNISLKSNSTVLQLKSINLAKSLMCNEVPRKRELGLKMLETSRAAIELLQSCFEVFKMEERQDRILFQLDSQRKRPRLNESSALHGGSLQHDVNLTIQRLAGLVILKMFVQFASVKNELSGDNHVVVQAIRPALSDFVFELHSLWTRVGLMNIIDMDLSENLIQLYGGQDDLLVELLLESVKLHKVCSGDTLIRTIVPDNGDRDRTFSSMKFVLSVLDYHTLAVKFFRMVSFDHLVLIDLLIGTETVFLEFLVQYLKLTHQESNPLPQLDDSVVNDGCRVYDMFTKLRVDIGRMQKRGVFPYDATALLRRIDAVLDTDASHNCWDIMC